MTTNPRLQLSYEYYEQEAQSARVLSQPEVQTMFPRSMHEQVFLTDILHWVQRERYARIADRAGEAAVAAAMLAERKGQLEQAKVAFCRLVSRGLIDVGVTEEQVNGPVCRVKEFAEAERKQIVRLYRHETRGIPLYPMPDLIAGEVIVKKGVSPDMLIWALHRHFSLPDEYPDGQRALQIGRTSHISAPAFQARKITVPFIYDGASHLSELRIWRPEEKAVDEATRLEYEANRACEYEEALTYFLSKED